MQCSISYRVPYADTDQMGVVYYANYLVYFERLRSELLRNAGFPYGEMEKQGIALPVIEATCRYKSPARYDELIEISGFVEEAKGAKIKMACKVSRNGELLAEGHTIHACINKDGRPIRVPQALVALVSQSNPIQQGFEK